MKEKHTYDDYLEAVKKDPDFNGECSGIIQTYAMRFMAQDERVKAGEMDAPLYLNDER